MWESETHMANLPEEKIEEIRQLINTARQIMKQSPGNHPPGFMFRVKQWLGDNNVMLMDWDARGMHMHFICICWQQDPPGTLPNDDTKLKRWAHNHPEWDRLKSQIFNEDPRQSSWKLVDDLWIQEAVLKEFIRQSEYRLTRKKAANKRWNKSISNAYAYPHGEQKLYSDAPIMHPSVQCVDNILFPSEKGVHGTPSTPGDVKLTGSSTPSEVKPVGSSDRHDVKPAECEQDSRKRGRTHPRLEIFMEEYQLATGREYIVGNYREEGGAAKNTVAKIPSDEVFRIAVKAYLKCKENGIREKGYPFLLFIRELNRWVKKGEESINAGKRDKYADVCE